MTEGGRAADAGTRVVRLSFSRSAVDAWRDPQWRHRNWPVVYTLNNERQVYVGETLSALSRMKQHLENPQKRELTTARIVVDETFNKSVCLDLESFLIKTLAGDGRFQVLNRNDGVTDADYFNRDAYRRTFEEIFERLRREGLFSKDLAAIQNSDLFKLSPFKALNSDQEIAITDIVEGLFDDLESGASTTSVVEGQPGTGKTIVAIFLLKLLADIRSGATIEGGDHESPFDEFFAEGYAELLDGLSVGIVIPQQALRQSVKRVFKATPGLSSDMVLTPFEVAKSSTEWGLLVVDETHRLTRYSAQAMGTLTRDYAKYSERLAYPGEDWRALTQIDWILRKSRHQVFLVDEGQAVRPGDVPTESLRQLANDARSRERHYVLHTQMRVSGGATYLDYVRKVLSDDPPREPAVIENYDVRFFDSPEDLEQAIRARDAEFGLSRLLAGYAWPWRSKGRDPSDPVWDIEIGTWRKCWNRSVTDWVNSPTSLDEVGSIHTIQGYDLNFAGVIIGRDLWFDTETQCLRFDRRNYFDKKGMANNRLLGETVSDDHILELVRNIYHVLLTRGMRGTYVYVCDEALRERLRPYFRAMAG